MSEVKFIFSLIAQINIYCFVFTLFNILINLLPRRVADKYYDIKKRTKQLHETASTFGFIKKSLHNSVIRTFAKVKGTFLREKREEDIMKSHLKKHQNNLSRVIKSFSKDKDSMVNIVGINFTLVLLKLISKEQLNKECYRFKLRTRN